MYICICICIHIEGDNMIQDLHSEGGRVAVCCSCSVLQCIAVLAGKCACVYACSELVWERRLSKERAPPPNTNYVGMTCREYGCRNELRNNTCLVFVLVSPFFAFRLVSSVSLLFLFVLLDLAFYCLRFALSLSIG